MKNKSSLLFYPGGMISLSCLMFISMLYLSFYLNSNQQYTIEIQSLNYPLSIVLERRAPVDYTGLHTADTKNIADFNETLKSWSTAKDTLKYLKVNIPDNISYGDFVKIVDLINLNNLKFSLLADENELFIWYPDPNYFERPMFMCGTSKFLYLKNDDLTEIDFKGINNSWVLVQLIILWLLLFIMNIKKIRQTYIRRRYNS